MSSNTKQSLPAITSIWTRAAQVFVGMFFVNAAGFKLFDAFFFARSTPLDSSIRWWLEQGFPLIGFRQILEVVVEHPWMVSATGIFVITLQATGGILLFSNAYTRIAGYCLLLVQATVYMSLIHGGIGYFTLVGISFWLAAFYILVGTMTRRKWTIFTYWLVIFGLAVLWHRYRVGDPWPSSFAWQFQHLSQDVMSISPSFKSLVLTLGEHPFAPYVWASAWWLQLLATLGLLTRFRVAAGAVWLLLVILQVWVWLNGIGAEVVLWVLTVFTWLAYEDASRREWGYYRMTPRWRDIKSFVAACRKWVNAR